MAERQQSLGEEIANSGSHGVALLAAIVGVAFLSTVIPQLELPSAVGIRVFAVTMLTLYSTSTIYHALPLGRAKSIVLKLDHGAIYLFIAGSYTPFAMGVNGKPWSWFIFCLIWALAIAGAVLKAFDRISHPWLSTALYLVMGWLVLMAAMPYLQGLPRLSADLLLAGGIAYTVGLVFYMIDTRFRYSHAIWHCFVAAGSGCHYFALLSYLA